LLWRVSRVFIRSFSFLRLLLAVSNAGTIRLQPGNGPVLHHVDRDLVVLAGRRPHDDGAAVRVLVVDLDRVLLLSVLRGGALSHCPDYPLAGLRRRNWWPGIVRLLSGLVGQPLLLNMGAVCLEYGVPKRCYAGRRSKEFCLILADWLFAVFYGHVLCGRMFNCSTLHAFKRTEYPPANFILSIRCRHRLVGDFPFSVFMAIYQ
jgi:hypothetical protein